MECVYHIRMVRWEIFVKVKASREPRLRTNGLAQIHTLNVNIPVHDLFSTNTNIHKNLLSEHI